MRVRLPSAIIGTLLIPAAYWMARELFGRRVGLLTAALAAITLWPLHLSLISFRAGSLPLFLALAIGAGVHAYRSGRAWHWIVAGMLYGLTFYTYLASRFTPIALALLLVLMLIMRRNKRLWRNLIIFAVTVAIVLTPLIFTALTQWEVVMGRPGDLSIFNPAINHGDPIGTLVRSTANAVGMFFWRGDRIPRHNVPYRPVFDPILVIFFALGLIRLIIAALRPDSAAAAAAARFSTARPGHALHAARAAAVEVVQPLRVDLDSGDVAADDPGGRLAAFLARGGRAARGLDRAGDWPQHDRAVVGRARLASVELCDHRRRVDRVRRVDGARLQPLCRRCGNGVCL